MTAIREFRIVSSILVLVLLIPLAVSSQDSQKVSGVGGKDEKETVSVGLGISPIKKDLTLSPGKYTTFKITAYNPNKNSTVFRVESKDVWRKNGELIVLTPGAFPKYQAAQNITVTPTAQKIKPGESFDFLVKVRAGNDWKGGYVARLDFSLGESRRPTKPEPLPKPTPYPVIKGAAIAAVVATTVIVHIKDTEIFKLENETVTIDTKSKPGRLMFKYTAANRSNTFIEPQLSAVLLTAEGRVIDKKQFIQFDRMVYPDGDSFEIEDQFERPIKPGKYKVIFTLNSGDRFLSTKQEELTIAGTNNQESTKPAGP